MDDTMDPNCLLVLADDTIRQILSFLPLKQRVRLSRSCSILGYVVEQSLHSIRTLKCDDWFDRSTNYDHSSSRHKTLAKLKNLEVISVDLKITHVSPTLCHFLSTLADNCHHVRRIHGWDMRIVHAFVKMLRRKGVPVTLKRVSPDGYYGSEEADLFQTLDLKLTNVPYITTTTTPHVYSVSCFHVTSVPQMLLMAKLRVIEGMELQRDADHLKLVLQHLPLLTDIGVCVHAPARNQVLRLLLHAKQQLTGLRMTFVHKMISFAGSESLDFDLMEQLVQTRGPQLRRFRLLLVGGQDDHGLKGQDVMALVLASCRNLMELSFMIPEIHVSVKDRLMTIYAACIPVTPFLDLMPKTSSIRVKHTWLHTLPIDPVILELQDFASRNKKRCIDVYFGSGERESLLFFEKNLRVFGYDDPGSRVLLTFNKE